MSYPRFDNNSSGQRGPRPNLLAACLATALGLGGLITPAIAANIVVKACSDADIYHPPLILFGLRSSVSIANSGDTIDMTELSNCTITLTDGAIPVTVNNLEFVGPNNQTLTIDGNFSDRVFNHTGTGDILFENLTIAHGQTAGNGGCIQSAGTVDLFVNVTVTGCSAGGKGGGIAAPYVQTNHSTISNNVGGGIYASGTRTIAPDAYLENSTISGNTGGAGLAGNCVGRATIQNSMIENNTSSTTSGGINMCCFGQNTASAVDMSYSSVVGNNGDRVDRFSGGVCAEYVYLSRSNVSGNKGQVGGILTGIGSGNGGYDFSANHSTIADNTGYVETGGVSSNYANIEYSTISGNQSGQSEGGVRAITSRFVNSTISGNHGYHGGGVSTNVGTFFNSTVAFNDSSTAAGKGIVHGGQYFYSGGITNLNLQCCNPSISMASTIVANNSAGSLNAESDVYVVKIYASTTLIALNSLIVSSNVPSSSLTADPLLLPLASNGGTVQTHALSPHSPAIGTGSNPKALGFDERGSGFARSWVNGQTDIGAYQTQDRIFYNGFQ